MIRKEAWSFYRTISGVRLCWELEEPKGPKGLREKWYPGGLSELDFPELALYPLLIPDSGFMF